MIDKSSGHLQRGFDQEGSSWVSCSFGDKLKDVPTAREKIDVMKTLSEDYCTGCLNCVLGLNYWKPLEDIEELYSALKSSDAETATRSLEEKMLSKTSRLIDVKPTGRWICDTRGADSERVQLILGIMKNCVKKIDIEMHRML